MDPGLSLFIILMCMLGSSFFSGMETGVISIHRMRLRHASRSGEHSSKLLEAYIADSDRLLGTTLTGNNICLVVMSVLATSMVSAYGSWAETSSTVIMSVAVLIFCEYLPKAWFRSRPLDRCRRFTRFLRISEIALYPISKAIVFSSMWFIPGSRKGFARSAPFVTREDLEYLVHEGEQTGVLSPKERFMIHRVFDLSDRKAREIMTPLRQMSFVEADMNLAEFYEVARRCGFTRMPVYDGNRDEYTGVINVFYVLSSRNTDPNAKVAAFARPPLFIDAEMPVDDILPKLRRFRQPMCLVKEKGEVAGLITTEDILEEIVGKL